MLTVALAGYGMAGADIHAPLIEEAGMRLAAVSTSSPERAERARAAHEGVRVVPDLDALLTLDDVDLVVLATPTGAHREHALACVTAGIPFVVDKPLGVDRTQCEEVVEAAAAAGVPFTVFHNRRFDPEQATMTRLVRDGSLGRVTRAELRWERWRPEPQRRWRETAPAAEGGGIMLDLQSHLVDAAVQALGPVRSVYAEVASRTTVAEDEAFLACRHEGDVTSHLSTTSLAGMPGPRYRVLGTAAAFVLNQFGAEPNLLPELDDASPEHAGWVYRGEDREPARRASVRPADYYRQVAAALVADDPQARMPVAPADAVHTAAVLDAARRSAASGQVVSLT